MSISKASDPGFGSAIPEQGVALVDFGARWCAPCRALLPLLEELDRDWEGRVSIVKLDVDESPETAARFGVLSMPTVIVFKDGQPVEKLVGLQPKAVYQSLVSKHWEI